MNGRAQREDLLFTHGNNLGLGRNVLAGDETRKGGKPNGWQAGLQVMIQCGFLSSPGGEWQPCSIWPLVEFCDREGYPEEEAPTSIPIRVHPGEASFR